MWPHEIPGSGISHRNTGASPRSGTEAGGISPVFAALEHAAGDFTTLGKNPPLEGSSPPSDTQGLPTELPVSYRQNSGGDLVFSMTPGSDTGADRGPAFPECWRACCGAAGWPGARLTCRAEGVEVAGAAHQSVYDGRGRPGAAVCQEFRELFL